MLDIKYIICYNTIANDIHRVSNKDNYDAKGKFMKATLTQLYYGDIRPFETCGAHNPKSREAARLVEETRKKLLCGLTDEQKKIMEAYEEYVSKMNRYFYEDCFACGYSYGVRMTMEAFEDD